MVRRGKSQLRVTHLLRRLLDFFLDLFVGVGGPVDVHPRGTAAARRFQFILQVLQLFDFLLELLVSTVACIQCIQFVQFMGYNKQY